MPDVIVKLGLLPIIWRPTAQAWYKWQEIVLRGLGYYPGIRSSDPSSYGFWNDLPPRMGDSADLRVGSTPALHFRPTDYGYSVDQEERGITESDVDVIRTLADLEKMALWRFANNARKVCGLPDLDLDWYRLGLNPRVKISNVLSRNPGWYSLTVDGEESERCWMTEMEAVSFSHALVLSYSELEQKLREGVPDDWFTLVFSEES